ncbi:MAG TPA: hypothetical protein VFA64_05715 [Hyphomicrobiaceae bacterium]|nr:hypothetical protein [Hyphomicrobiaceae bacterium]
MAHKLTSLAAVVAAALLLVTVVDGYRQSGSGREPGSEREAVQPVPAAHAEPGPCALDYARFGGQRAQLIKIVRGSVANFIVLEVASRDPLQRSQRVRWLRAAYGEAEHVWLGEFVSPEAALERAVQLCPPAWRCGEGEEGCGRITPLVTPIRAFFHQPPNP